jgi:hypothetical protein
LGLIKFPPPPPILCQNYLYTQRRIQIVCEPLPIVVIRKGSLGAHGSVVG